MEKDQIDELHSICLDKIRFIISSESKVVTKKMKRPNFLSKCNDSFFLNLKAIFANMKTIPKKIMKRKIFRKLEEFNFVLAKFIQFLVEESKLYRIEEKEIRPRCMGIELFYLDIHNGLIELFRGKEILFSNVLSRGLYHHFEGEIFKYYIYN